jgi:hypothetical protein
MSEEVKASEEKQLYGYMAGFGAGFTDARSLASKLTWFADFAANHFGEDVKVLVSGNFQPAPEGEFVDLRLANQIMTGPNGEKFVVLELSNR